MNQLFVHPFTDTINDTLGFMALVKSLKVNTTLKELNLNGDHLKH